MSKDAEQTIRNYEVMLRLGANGRVTEDEIQRRVANYSTASIMQRAVEGQVRLVLNCHGVSTIMNAFYQNFARELGKLTKQDLPKRMFDAEFRLLFDKWAGRGLERVVLRDIAISVFNIIPAAEEVCQT